MYASHFNLTDEAFSLTPDPFFLYLSPGHAEALAALKVGLQARRGLVVMTGEVGTGKTTLLYSLLNELGGRVRTAYVANTKMSFDEILRLALADFGIQTESRDRLERLTALNTFLRQCAADGTTAALVIDEAQNLEEDALENLRLLSNFETFTGKLLQIVLVGQPELESKLGQPGLRQIAERVAVRCQIERLTRRESRDYIEHRLRRVGGSLDLFTSAAVRLIVRKSEGLPRRINVLCHTALLFAFGRGAKQVTRTFVRAAVNERELGRFAAARWAAQRWMSAGWPAFRAAAVAAAFGVVAITLWSGGFLRPGLSENLRASEASPPTMLAAEPCVGSMLTLSPETTYGGIDVRCAWGGQR